MTEGEDPAAIRKTVLERTGGGAAAAFDAVAGEVGALALACLRPEGTSFVYGLLSGQPIPLDAGRAIFSEVGVRGVWRTRWVREAPREVVVGALRELAEAVRDGALALPVEAEYDLGLWPQALDHARQPGRTGKVLLIG